MRLVDRPPPSRFAVVEKGGRLVVIDRESGTTPPTAAERMAAHDRARGIEPIRPVQKEPSVAVAAAAAAATAPEALDTHRSTAKDNRPAAAPARSPWSGKGAKAGIALRPPANPAPVTRTPRPAGNRQIIVTGKWWDEKGPRTIELGPLGQTQLRNGLLALFAVLVGGIFLTLLIAPVLLLLYGFLLFRFGRNLFAPIGAKLIDKALAEQE